MIVRIVGESKACRAFLFNKVSKRNLHRFLWEMIITILRNGTAREGEIRGGRLDSRAERGRI